MSCKEIVTNCKWCINYLQIHGIIMSKHYREGFTVFYKGKLVGYSNINEVII